MSNTLKRHRREPRLHHIIETNHAVLHHAHQAHPLRLLGHHLDGRRAERELRMATLYLKLATDHDVNILRQCVLRKHCLISTVRLVE